MNYKQNQTLKIGYTYGDLTGIGPEIFQKFFFATRNHPNLEIILIDDENEVKNLQEKITLGQPCPYSGGHAYKTLKRASELLCNKELDYLITGPVAKESLWLAGIEYSGQTELLASINGLTKDDIEMFFLLDDFRIVLATRHVALKDVPQELSRRLKKVFSNSTNGLKNIFKISEPKIAVAGLNPHAGENGLIGDEEKKIMRPIIEELLKESKQTTNSQIQISGPLAADALLADAAQKYLKNQKLDYDLYVTAYHDQALPLIKGLGGFRAINLTVGLPFLRLSVDHGTGFDIVGKNLASPEALKACTDYCFKLKDLEITK